VANHKSALKRHRQSLVRRARNRANKSKIKTAIRKVDEAIAANAVDQVQEALRAAIPVIDKAAVKGAIHKRTAARKVSRLTRRVNAFLKSA